MPYTCSDQAFLPVVAAGVASGGRAGVAGMTGRFRGYGMGLFIPVTGPAGNDPGRGSARPGQPSFTAVPEALTISMLLPTDS